MQEMEKILENLELDWEIAAGGRFKATAGNPFKSDPKCRAHREMHPERAGLTFDDPPDGWTGWAIHDCVMERIGGIRPSAEEVIAACRSYVAQKELLRRQREKGDKGRDDRRKAAEAELLAAIAKQKQR